MKYDAKEEILATGEWLMKINEAEVAEELLYVPSQLERMGVAPRDVVDLLPYLRNRAKIEPRVETRRAVGRASVPTRTTPAVLVLEKVEVPPVPELGASAPVETERVSEPWDWTTPVEISIEEMLRPEPGLPAFNQLASLTHREPPKPAPVVQPSVDEPARVRGKRARARGTAQ